MQALPRRAWQSIREHASKIGLARVRKGLAGGNPSKVYYNTMSWDDVEVISRLSGDPQEQDRLRQVANDLATQTVRGGLSAHWLLSLEDVGYPGVASDSAILDSAIFNVSLQYGAHR
jgi:hypothetical protein